MSSLRADFDELLRRIEAGREFAHASFEPIFYLVFEPAAILDVKREMPGWHWRLSNAGWQVQTFSIAQHVAEILAGAPMREIWLAADQKAPLDWSRTNASLANALTSRQQLQLRLEALLTSLEGQRNAIVLVTDLEALHPYLRIGAIEAHLQGKFHVPTVFFYPGVRAGKTGLRFLGFYPEDGNYRSVHVGG
ncbi:MAG: DUF1788 domain-containing protein [Azospirillum sp.]|nr:DUF1788 domain-containing protein [Azospirillum sp.]